MNKALVTLLVFLALAGCAKLQSAYDTVTNLQVPRKTITVAISSFNVAKATATNYIRYCTPNPAPKGCDITAIKEKVIPAVRSGTIARDSLREFLTNNPGVLGPSGTYNALVSATSTITAIKMEFAQ